MIKELWIQMLANLEEAGPIGSGMIIWASGVMVVAVFLLVIDKLKQMRREE